MTEDYLRESGVAFTILRDCLYLDLLPEMFDARTGVISGPSEDGRAAFVARDDVARVAAHVVADKSCSGCTYDVTGPEALSLNEVAELLSHLTGRQLRYNRETVEEGRRWRAASGAPDWEVETWLGSYLAIARGELQPCSHAVAELTGRAPLGLNAYFAAHKDFLQSLRAT